MTMAIEQDSAKVRFPPPLVYFGLLLTGFGAERFVRLRSFGLDRPLLVAAGVLLIAAGALMIAAAIGLFRRAGTPPEPWTATQRIVDTGIYGRTRNPMYVGMALIYAGLAVAFDGPVALLLLAVAMLIIRTQVIAREENYLDGKFGEEYRAYKARVRRWL
ncbi:MAG: methyltransferase family protein [Allosphingosinicella sp.]